MTNPKVSSRSSKALKTQMEPLAASLPVDIFIEIFAHFLDDLRLKRTMINPIISALQVSKFWNKQLISGQFRVFLFGHPKYAYLSLKVRHDLSSENALQWMIKAAPIIDIPSGIKLLFKAQTALQIDALGRIPVFQKIITIKTLSEQLSYGRRHKFLSHVVPTMTDVLFDFDPRDCIIDFFDSKSKLVLHKMPALEIVKLLFLEDVFDADLFSSIYAFSSWQIFRAYLKGKQDVAKSFVDALRALRLPKSGLEALSTVMAYQMVCATIMGDRNLFKFLNVNLDLCDPEVFCYQEVIEVMKQFVEGKIEYYPSNKLHLIKKTLKEGFKFSVYTYPRSQFKLKKRQILQDPDVSETNKEIVRRYFPNF